MTDSQNILTYALAGELGGGDLVDRMREAGVLEVIAMLGFRGEAALRYGDFCPFFA